MSAWMGRKQTKDFLIVCGRNAPYTCTNHLQLDNYTIRWLVITKGVGDVTHQS